MKNTYTKNFSKKLLISCCAVFAFFTFFTYNILASDITITPEMTTFKGNSTDEGSVHFTIGNNSNAEKSVKLSIEVVSLANSHYYTVCITSCYAPKTVSWTTPAFSVAASGNTGNTADINCNPSGASGTSVFKLKAFDANDTTDFQECTITFNMGTTSVDQESSSDLTLAPIPAQDFININSNNSNLLNSISGAKFEVYNESGNLVKEDILTNGNNTINTSALSSGNYFYSIITDGKKVKTGSFNIVK